MITEFNTLPKKIYYVQTAEACTVLDADGEPLAEISAPGGYFPGIGSPDAATGTVTFSTAVKRVIGPFDLAPQLQLTLLGLLGGTSDGLPAGYTPLEYLESTGTQYIDTGYYPCWDSEISGTLQCTSDLYSQSFFATVAQKATESGGVWQDCYFFTMYSNGYSAGWLAFGNSVPGLGSGPLPDALNSKTAFFESKEEITLNGKTTVFYPVEPTNFRTQNALYLFARNYQNQAELFAYARIFAFSISENGVSKRNFIPCLSPTGTPGMFDLVQGRFYSNAGTGDFLYPGKEQEVSTFSLRRPVTYAQLTALGLRRLYRVPRGYNGTKEEFAQEHCFKPLVETPQPEEGYWSPQWRETEEEIVLDWVETEPPAELETA